MPRPQIPTEKITALPLMSRAAIGEEHLDAMGHMNVRWYLALFDDAAWTFFSNLGMSQEYYEANDAGGFALQHFISYLAEVREGETVAIYARLLGRSEKRVHFMYFMLNETTSTLAATLEGLGSHADLKIRRTSPYPPHIAANIDALVNEHKQLDWAAPVCGAIKA